MSPGPVPGMLTVLNYPEYAPDVGASTYPNLPSDSFEALRQVIEEKKIQRLVLDTILRTLSHCRRQSGYRGPLETS